jgi:hypothetical protein
VEQDECHVQCSPASRGVRDPAVVMSRQVAAIGCAIAGLVWTEELHFFMTEPDERLVGEAPVEPLRRGEDGREASLGARGVRLGYGEEVALAVAL